MLDDPTFDDIDELKAMRTRPIKKAPPKAKDKIKVAPLPTSPTVLAQDAKDEIMLFYGPPGVGKTTFVNDMAPKVFFLSTDRGTRSLKALRRECSRWEDFKIALAQLSKPDAPKYDIICVDHVDDWANNAEDYVCAQMGIDSLGDAGFAKGWRAFKKELLMFLGGLKALNTGIVFIAHEAVKTVKTRAIEVDRTMPDMGKSAWKVIVPLVSVVGFCGYTRVKVKGGDIVERRTLTTTPTEAVYAKDRTRRNRPKSIEYLSGEAFIQTFHQSTTPTKKRKIRGS